MPYSSLNRMLPSAAPPRKINASSRPLRDRPPRFQDTRAQHEPDAEQQSADNLRAVDRRQEVDLVGAEDAEGEGELQAEHGVTIAVNITRSTVMSRK